MSAFDTGLPLPSGRFYFTTGERPWKPAGVTELEALLQGSQPPEFRTILAIQGAPDFERMTAEEQRRLAYLGPLYADLDGESIEEAIDAFKRLLDKLRGEGLDLAQVRLYATGGRGFHIEVPPACFVPGGLPVGGVVGLPHIYREIAQELYVDCMDMRVYSARKGRMWRVPNRQRDNGQHKVPMNVGQALTMTPDAYVDLCSAPRAFPALAAPTFCAALGLLYVKARDKVSGQLRKRRKSPAKVREALQKRFTSRGYALPTSLLALAHGHVSAREGAGWNQICIQLALTAHAIGLELEQLVSECRHLIENHCGDSARYGTPSRREAELRKAFDYLDGGLYDFTAGGVKSILPKGMPCGDLEGL